MPDSAQITSFPSLDSFVDMSGNQNENSENEPETLEAYNLSFDPNSKSVSSFNERSKPVFLKPEDVELAWIDALGGYLYSSISV